MSRNTLPLFRSVRLPAALLATALLSACAATSGPRSAAVSADKEWAAAEQALRSERWQEAKVPLARLLQQDLRNGQLQFLHALSEENLAREQDLSRLELATVGYANATRFAPGHFWALLRMGFLALERGEHEVAQTHFAAAAVDQPERWEAFYGLGVASYYRRDLPVLKMAARRSAELAPEQPDVMRLGAFALAAAGDPAAAGVARRLGAAGTEHDMAAWVERRVGEYLKQAADVRLAPGAGGESSGVVAPTLAELSPTQVVVEVTILLNSVLDQASRGINLFDGLRVLYGFNDLRSEVRDSLTGRQSTRTITSQISTPQLNYSLNLFNDSGQYYSVVARPSITAHLGRESKFFAGRTVNVEVSGINLGQLQPIDVGVQLTVRPERIDGNNVTFVVDATRSFLSQEQIGTFSNSLTTFRQSVSATADVAFGQTLVLSALSEQVGDKSFSKVPVAGEVPMLGRLFNRSTDLRRQESLLILVTPTLPLTMTTGHDLARRDKTVQLLLDSWQTRVEPISNVPAILGRLHQMRWLRDPKPGDLRVSLPQARDWQREAINESLLLARQ